jgi:hypothetical protein
MIGYRIHIQEDKLLAWVKNTFTYRRKNIDTMFGQLIFNREHLIEMFSI